MMSGMMDGQRFCGCAVAGKRSWSGVFDLSPWTAAVGNSQDEGHAISMVADIAAYLDNLLVHI